MHDRVVSPLHPTEFFSGVWRGEGEFLPHQLLRWIVPAERVRYLSRVIWLSETAWKVEESFEFSSGRAIERKVSVEVVGPERLHVSADDMPSGANIILHERGFSFTPYYILADYGGRKWRLRCVDENRVDEDGVIHDTIKIYFFRVHVATMKLTVKVGRQAVV